MQPFATKLDIVVTGNDREIIFDVSAPQQLVDRRLQEERIAEAEHRRVGRHVRRNSVARSHLACIREVSFVHFSW